MNYVAVSEALQTTPSILAAGLAADNLICAIYFTSLFALAANIPPDAPTAGTVSYNLVYEYFYTSQHLLVCAPIKN